MDSLVTELTNVSVFCCKVRNDLSGALAEKADLLAALLAREREVADANSHIEQLQTELRALAVDLDDREGAVSRLDSRVASLEEELAEARRDLQSEAGRLAAYRDALHQVPSAEAIIFAIIKHFGILLDDI
jgi:predicted nuclease with TOPRIM domain